MYLDAAGSTLSGDEEPGQVSAEKLGSSGFRYVKETFGASCAVLEFETSVGGKFVNGVDIITCNDGGQIVEFKVMVRPLQAVNLLHERMAAMLEKMQGGR